MLRPYKYRIYPTDEQKFLFAKTFGCCIMRRSTSHCFEYACHMDVTGTEQSCRMRVSMM